MPPAASIPPISGPKRPSLVEREREALAAHRASLIGSEIPPPDRAPRGTFLHGFLLPFSLIASTLRDRELRAPYLKVTAVRIAAVVAITLIAFSGNTKDKKHRPGGGAPKAVVVHEKHRSEKHTPVKVDIPGVHVDLDVNNGKEEIVVLGQKVPVVDENGDIGATAKAEEPAPPPPTTTLGRAWAKVKDSWAWLLALVAFMSGAEGIVVFLSRRYDDWMSFHASRLARIRPEDAEPKERKLAFDLPWLYRKLKRRIRGYVVFAAGVPAFLVLRLIPYAGNWAFSIALTLWAWYWLGVFTAAKSAHAWADEATAPSPKPIRMLNDRVSKGFFVFPLRLYGRAWAWITRSVNPAAATFERSPAAYLGLALARAILSLPFLYLFVRPLVPVAAGRLCAESDPGARFSVVPASASAADPAGAATGIGATSELLTTG